MTRARSPSPDHADAVAMLKRLKTGHSANGVTTPDDPSLHFASGLLDHTNIAKLNKEYATSGPYKYAFVEKLFQDELLKSVKDECMSEISFTEKETDIYKVNQTGDLASLNYLGTEDIQRLPNLLKLRDALYCPAFRSFVRTVTGCGPLSGSKQDMSVNSYTKGCHLLTHDDVIGTRRISYILYMPLPNYQLWQKEWGGALELYPVRDDGHGGLEPEAIPSKMIPPSWNQFIFFEVQPGYSFHSVEEVVVGGEGEDGRARLSISGWFHAAQEGEEGYDPAVQTHPELKSSRDQLASSSTAFQSYSDAPSDDGSSPGSQTVEPPEQLSDEQVVFLSEYLNPVYLQERTMQALAARFIDESSLELHSFLTNELAEALEPRLRNLDLQDGLGPDRGGLVPPHTAGIASAAGGPSTWTVKGPPHKWRYCSLVPPTPGRAASSVTPLSAQPSPSEILRVLQDELFPSTAFRTWITIVTKLLPLRHNVEARRFRPGLDYTLATSEESEARLDVVLGLTPEPVDPEQETVGRRRTASKPSHAPAGWQSGLWGGWECYMAPHNEEDDPAVYRSGTYKKSAVNSEADEAMDQDKPESSLKSKSSDAEHENHSSPEASEHHSHSEDGMEEDGEDDEADSTLLTAQPGFNRLLLVLRDERVMRFVKYVSAAADGSRWDVCAEYEVGKIQEEDEEEGEEE
ncbi:nuclear protein [Cylindrobasidium torrendii FP15055 ss-10]|uniref:uS12 prolyl 3,4-dihydroxylase n=1 Tax=Cylindrobasidium torrendii FP15055 ss-10 TaxID=1314674 RepID=A0A0D7BTU5_9AGAR|nr:nuclear protein [Cylindrobasidium torrendii FP15055 ss-10]